MGILLYPLFWLGVYPAGLPCYNPLTFYDLETCVTRFRYEEWKTPNKVVEKLQAAVKKYSGRDIIQDSIQKRELVTWVNDEGNKVRARFVKLVKTEVTLQRAGSGNAVDYPLAKLSTESQKLAKTLAQKYGAAK